MSTHEDHIRTIDNYAKLIVEHEELKRQYDELQTNFHLLAGKKFKDIIGRYRELVDAKQD